MKISYIKFRCTHEEKMNIQRKACDSHRTISDFCRDKIFHDTVHQPPKLTLEEVEYFKTLHRFNSNFARIANLIKSRSPELADEVRSLLADFKHLFYKFFPLKHE